MTIIWFNYCCFPSIEGITLRGILTQSCLELSSLQEKLVVKQHEEHIGHKLPLFLTCMCDNSNMVLISSSSDNFHLAKWDKHQDHGHHNHHPWGCTGTGGQGRTRGVHFGHVRHSWYIPEPFCNRFCLHLHYSVKCQVKNMTLIRHSQKKTSAKKVERTWGTEWLFKAHMVGKSIFHRRRRRILELANDQKTAILQSHSHEPAR